MASEAVIATTCDAASADEFGDHEIFRFSMIASVHLIHDTVQYVTDVVKILYIFMNNTVMQLCQ